MEKITWILRLSTKGRIFQVQKWRCLWHIEDVIKRTSVLLEEKRNCCKDCRGSWMQAQGLWTLSYKQAGIKVVCALNWFGRRRVLRKIDLTVGCMIDLKEKMSGREEMRKKTNVIAVITVVWWPQGFLRSLLILWPMRALRETLISFWNTSNGFDHYVHR